MMELVERVERIILWLLIILLMLSVLLGTIELGRVVIDEIILPPFLLISTDVLFHSFGLLLIVLIGLELVRLLKLHLSNERHKHEIVIEVAIIAMCNKVVTLDLKTTPPNIILGLAAVLVALALGYFVLSKARKPE
jgi:uncharacterized membrane protein (DUF373 family)